LIFFDKEKKRKQEEELLRLRQADAYARLQDMSSRGELAYSRRWVAVLSSDESMRARVAGLLADTLKAKGYAYVAEPTVADAINSSVVLMDVRPKIDAKMHAHYDKMLRIKKSMGKFGKDLLCVIGPRSLAWQYPRGTYGEAYMFCYDEKHPDAYDRAIPPDGKMEIGGPILFNFADLAYVIEKWMEK